MARSSLKSLEIKSALDNLACIQEIAAADFHASKSMRDYRATFLRNEQCVLRWVSVLKRNGQECPAYIKSHFPAWGYEVVPQ